VQEGTLSAMFETNFGSLPWETEELLAFAFVGVICGLVAASYVRLNALFVKGRKKLMALPMPDRNGSMSEIFRHYSLRFLKSNYTYCIFIIIVTSIIAFPYQEFRFLGLSQGAQVKDLFSNYTIGSKVLANESTEAGQEFLKDWAHPNLLLNLLIFIAFKVALTAVSTTLPIPAGVFMPTFALGAGVGRFMGEVMALWFPHGVSIDGTNVIIPGGYSVVGAAAMAGGVTGTISSAVIVFELTGELDFIVPVLVAVLMSIVTRDLLSPTVFDSIAELKGLPYLTPNHYFKKFTKLLLSEEVMTPLGLSERPESLEDLHGGAVPYLTTSTTEDEAERIVSRHDFLFYPLLDSLNEMRILGGVQKTVLDSYLKGKKKKSTCLRSRRLSAQQVSPQDEEANQQDALVEAPPSDEEQVTSSIINFFQKDSGLVVDPAPFCVDPGTPLDVLRNYFTKLGLNYTFVTQDGFPVGLITRQNIIQSEQGPKSKKC